MATLLADPMLSDLVARWGVASVLVLVGACMQGVSGVGFGVFAAPILAIIDPELVPGPMLFLGLVIAVLAVRRERSGLDTKGIGFAMLGRVPASIAAALAMSILPVREISIMFALLILAGVAISLARFEPRISPATMFGAGCLSGFMGTITSVGTPPIALMYQNAPKPTLRASLGGFLFLGSLTSIVALSFTGRFGVHDVVLGTWLIAPLWLGFWLSTPLTRRLPGRTVRLAVLGLSALAALLLLVRQLVG
ncbi:sulfite exporter TauE/SafE family protein [Rhodoplanes elegans]|nr:sulfite exporter TauE/SafE family protein [Rhodoplanes elegans]